MNGSAFCLVLLLRFRDNLPLASAKPAVPGGRSCDFASALSQQNSCSAILEPRKSGGYKFEPNPSQKQQLMLENEIKFKKLTK